MGEMRTFDSGATRNVDDEKLDFDGFLSPLVLHRYAEYLNKHRDTSDGLRDSDQWQLGMPLAVYMKSAFRHFFYWWAYHRKADIVVKENIEESLCGLLFNAMGYLHEYLKDKAGDYNAIKIDGPEPKFKAGDKIRINLHFPIGSEIEKACEKANYIGVYVRKSDNDNHIIDVGVLKERWFFNDEIFPVEDN